MDRVMSPSSEAGGPGATAVHCRLEISRRLRKGRFPLHRRHRGEAQAFTNIFRLEIRVFGENLMFLQPACHQPQHRGDRNSEAAHAGYSSHVRRIDGDALQFFVPACLLMAQAPLPVDKCRNRWFERGVPAAAGSSLLQFHRIRRQKVCLPASYIYQVECRHRRNSAASIRSWRYQGALRTSELRPSTTPQPAPPIPRHVPRDGT